MGLFSTIKYILKHPINQKAKAKALWRFIAWQINVRLNPYPIIYSFTERSKLIIARGMTGATGNLYCGLHEFNDMSFLLHFLRDEDLFVDIGANIGSYTVLAAAHTGASVISIEPVRKTFDHLINNLLVNNIRSKVELVNSAVGSTNGFIDFTSDLDTINHVATGRESRTTQVKVQTLDSIVEARRPILLKIDVEGFETEVIKGGEGVLLSKNLMAVIIELNGSGARYGYDEKGIDQKLRAFGFLPHSYNPMRRIFDSMNLVGGYNTIYLKDVAFALNRVSSAPKFQVLGKVL